MKSFILIYAALFIAVGNSSIFATCLNDIQRVFVDSYAPLSDDKVEELFRDFKRTGSHDSIHKLALSFYHLYLVSIDRVFGHDHPERDDMAQKFFHKILVKDIANFDPTKMPGGKTVKDKMMLYLTRYLSFRFKNIRRKSLAKKNLNFVSGDLESLSGEIEPNGLIDRHVWQEGRLELIPPSHEELISTAGQLIELFNEFIIKDAARYKANQSRMIEMKRAIFFDRWLNGQVRESIADRFKVSRPNIEQLEARLLRDFVAFVKGKRTIKLEDIKLILDRL